MAKAFIRGSGIHNTDTFALVNKTGDWRVYTPVVDNSKCISCKICSQYCPDDCIERLVVDKSTPTSAQRIKIDYDYCKGCGICAHECPKGAIQMVVSEV